MTAAAAHTIADASFRPSETAVGVPLEVEDPTDGRRTTGRRFVVPGWVRRLAGPVLLLALWWAVTGFHVVDSRSLTGPGSVFRAAHEMWGSGELPRDLGASLSRVGWGLAIGVAVGLALAVVSGFFRLGEDLLDSSMNILRTVPVVALTPLIIVWMGIGEPAKIFLIATGTAFPIYMNTFAAIRGVDNKLVEAGKAFGLGRLGLIRRVIVPGAVPGFLVGLRWSWGVAWLLLIFAEQVNASSGIGYLMTQAQSWNRTDIIIMGVVLYGLLGLLGDVVVRLLEGTLLSWRRGFVGT
jgi:sulfonate transport system permease protein